MPGELHDNAGVHAPLLQVADESAAEGMESGWSPQPILVRDTCFGKISVQCFVSWHALPKYRSFGFGKCRPGGAELRDEGFQYWNPVGPAALRCLGTQEKAGIFSVQVNIGPDQPACLPVPQPRKRQETVEEPTPWDDRI